MTLLQLLDEAERALGTARMAVQGQDHARAASAIDSARLHLAQARILIERPPTGEFPALKR